MSKVEGEGGPIEPPPPKASCNYFFFETSRVNTVEPKNNIKSGVHY